MWENATGVHEKISDLGEQNSDKNYDKPSGIHIAADCSTSELRTVWDGFIVFSNTSISVVYFMKIYVWFAAYPFAEAVANWSTNSVQSLGESTTSA